MYTEEEDLISLGKLFHRYTILLKYEFLKRVVAAEPQLGSTLFLTLHDVLAFSCPVPAAELCIVE